MSLTLLLRYALANYQFIAFFTTISIKPHPVKNWNLVYNTQTLYIQSINAIYMTVVIGIKAKAQPKKHPGTTKRSRKLVFARPPKAPPSKYPGDAMQSWSLNAGMLESYPLSMQLGLWSRWVGKNENAIAKNGTAIPNPNKMRKMREKKRCG